MAQSFVLKYDLIVSMEEENLMKLLITFNTKCVINIDASYIPGHWFNIDMKVYKSVMSSNDYPSAWVFGSRNTFS